MTSLCQAGYGVIAASLQIEATVRFEANGGFGVAPRGLRFLSRRNRLRQFARMGGICGDEGANRADGGNRSETQGAAAR
jgi:hypothetical protein